MKVLFEPNSLLVSLFETYPSYFSVSTWRLTKVRSARDFPRKLVGTDTSTDRLVVAKRIYFVWKVPEQLHNAMATGQRLLFCWSVTSGPLSTEQKLHWAERDTPRDSLYCLYFVHSSKPWRQRSERFREFVGQFKYKKRRLNLIFVPFQGSRWGIKMILHVITTLMIIVKIMPKMYKVLIPSRKILLYLVFILYKVINI